MTRTNIKKLYLGVYTKDGEHIPIRLISLIAEEFAKSYIFAYCKASLMENDLLEDNQ